MRARVLVVEDLRIWRNNMKRALKKTYDVDTAATYEAARQQLRDNAPYQVVVTDLGLSEDANNTDGIKLLQYLKTTAPTTTTIAVSGRPAFVNESNFIREYGALVFLERGKFTMDEFVTWVDKGVQLSQLAE